MVLIITERRLNFAGMPRIPWRRRRSTSSQRRSAVLYTISAFASPGTETTPVPTALAAAREVRKDRLVIINLSSKLVSPRAGCTHGINDDRLFLLLPIRKASGDHKNSIGLFIATC
ncbi:MAG: hypothetical protein KDJ67_12400 [Nitratireductor sp.]|nr:hypothetical protein [Nitratireductor sp.]